MKQISQRERIMVTVLPTGVLLLIYLFFFAQPNGAELKKLRRQVDTAREREPTNQQRTSVLMEMTGLEKQVKIKRAAALDRKQREEELRAFWNDPDAKARGGEVISNLLAANGAVLVEEAVAEDSDRNEFADLLEELPSADLWRLRVAGTYSAISKTVAAISLADLPIVPAGIEMEPRVEGNRTIHLWNLWICR